MKNQLKWGSILSYVQMAASAIVNLLFTPIMLRLLGSSEYGLYNTVVSTISMLSILSLGFNSSYIKYFSKYKSENDEHSIKKLNGLFLIIFSVIGLVALFCGLFLSFNLDIVFSDGLTLKEYSIARVLMILLTCNLAISFPSSVFQNIISAHEKYIFLKIVNMFRTLGGPLVSIPVLLLGGRSIAMVSVLLIFYFIADFLHIYYALKKLKIRFSFGKPESKLFKHLLSYTIFIAINIVVDQVNWNIGKVLLGRFKGTTAVSIYSVGYTISTFYNMFSTSISGVFTPRIHRIITANDKNEQYHKLTDLFIRVGRIQFLILGLISSGFILFGKQFITEFWAGKNYSESYYVALFLMIPVTIPLIQNIGIEIQRALNKHRFRSLVYLFMAVFNLMISIILCQKYGAVGSAIGTAFSLIIANGIIMNIYYHKKCNVNIILFWKNIISMGKGLIIPIFSGILLLQILNTYAILEFIFGVLCYAAIYGVSMYFFAMNDAEKSLLLAPIKKIVTRR